MKDKIRAAAWELIEEDGLINLSCSKVCQVAGVPVGTFQHFMNCTFTEFLNELTRTHRDLDAPPEVTRGRAHPKLRKRHILDVAVALASKNGFGALSQSSVAEAAGVSRSLINQYYMMDELKDAVMREAVRLELLSIVGYGIFNRDPIALAAPDTLQKRILLWYLT